MNNESNVSPTIPRVPNKFLYFSLGIIVIIFAVLLIIIWQLGFFDFTGTDASSTVVAAAVALIGTILTAVVSVVGILIKHSFDQQNLSRQWEAEQRLNLEAAIRALDLFSTGGGKPTPDTQRDGALFTLANLGQYELTLELVDNLLDKGQLSAGTASSLISNALLRGNESIKEKAINVLYDKPEYFLTPEGVEIPSCLENWVPGLPVYVREMAILAIAESIHARPPLGMAGEISI